MESDVEGMELDDLTASEYSNPSLEGQLTPSVSSLDNLVLEEENDYHSTSTMSVGDGISAVSEMELDQMVQGDMVPSHLSLSGDSILSNEDLNDSDLENRSISSVNSILSQDGGTEESEEHGINHEFVNGEIESDNDDDDGDDSVSDVGSIVDENATVGWIDEPIYDDSTVSRGEALYRILKLYVENNLTKKALGDVLETIDAFLPDGHLLPRTKHLLMREIEKLLPHSHKDTVTKHRICSECCNYLGKWLEPTIDECIRCHSNDINSFFLEYSIEALIKDAFEMRNLHSFIDEYRAETSNQDPDKLYDITSGSEYRRLKRIAIPGDYDLFFIWYTDGAQTARNSSGSSIWPIFIQIANIAPRHRRSFQFVCGLFYSNHVNAKPDMNSYLFPFAVALQNAFHNSIEWYHPTLRRTIYSKIIAPLASLDAPARASADNTMQYNGEYGCSGCEHPGETSEIGSGTNRVFPVLPKDPILRTNERMKNQSAIAKKYVDLVHFKGVKGDSIVSEIPHFDRAKGFPPEYLHAILLGVLKMLLILWCSSQYHEEEYYLNPRVRAIIDKDLKRISPPDNVTRTPETLHYLKQWKASHFRAFLSYGPVVLKGRLANVYYEHFLLLVKAVHILSKNVITNQELDLAETVMYIFVIDMEKLYGRNKCSYNVHQLLHMTHYVRLWGPLWSWSAFSSEDGNGKLLRRAHGSKQLDVELFNTIRMINAYKAIRSLTGFDAIEKNQTPKVLGLPARYKFLQSEVVAIKEFTNFTDDRVKSIDVYKRCTIDNDVFTSDLYKRQKVRLNSCVSCRNKTLIGVIKLFFKFNNEAFCIIRKLVESKTESLQIMHEESLLSFSDIVSPVRETYCLVILPVNEIENNIIRANNYICHLPNDFERK